MSYRNDLAAAQARADAAMRELETERDGRERDESHMAGLERGLAAALQELAILREKGTASPIPHTPQASSRVWIAIAGLTVSLLLLLGIFAMTSKKGKYKAIENNLVYEEAEMHFDASARISSAKGAATRFFEDDVRAGPFLLSLEAKAVADDGLSYLEHGGVEYEYGVELNPMEVPKSSSPIGTRVKERDDRTCRVTVTVSDKGIRYPNPKTHMGFPQFGSCNARSFVPRCTLAQIRKRSLADGAPKGALATVSIHAGNPWYVRIVDRGEVLFEEHYPDDC